MVTTRLESYLNQQDKVIDTTLSRREIAYLRLKDAIKHAALEPGEPLTETQLSRLLGISRTPVREALQQLVQEGLAESMPGQAVKVAMRSIQDVLDVVHIRSLIEPEMVRLASEAMSQTEIVRLEQVMNAMEKAADDHDVSLWTERDISYHQIIKDACPNKLLGETVLQLKDRVHHLANLDTHMDKSRLSACTAEHRQVVEAIKASDSQAAKQAMHEHITALTNSLLKRISYR